MKNKYIYILFSIIVLMILIVYSVISYLNINFSTSDSKNSELINILDEDLIKKNIDINMDNFDPSIYKTVNEFLGYFINGSGITLNVDLLEENFYIYTYTNNKEEFIINKFDEDLIISIDKSDNKTIKDQAILDIFNSYKINGYIQGEPNSQRSGVRILEPHELSSNMQLHNNILLPYSGESSLETTKRLEDKKNKTDEDNQQLSYLYDFSGDYKQSLALKESTGIEKITYKIEGRAFNLGNSLKGAKIELLNYDNIVAFTNDKGEYTLEFETFPLSRLRLRASYDNLSDGYNGVYVVFNFDNQSSEDINFSLHINDTKELISSKDLTLGKIKIVESSIGNTFEFKEGVLLDVDGKVYNGDFNVEIFEFNRNTPGMESFLTLDNFDNLSGYTGDMMITNGMTYLLVRDLEGNELFISKKNPIVTRQNVDIEYLLNNSQNGTSVLTDSQLDLILKKSEEEGYTVDNIFLTNRGITGFTPWWVLNRTRGIWENNPIKLLNKSGLKESFYYNID